MSHANGSAILIEIPFFFSSSVKILVSDQKLTQSTDDMKKVLWIMNHCFMSFLWKVNSQSSRLGESSALIVSGF